MAGLTLCNPKPQVLSPESSILNLKPYLWPEKPTFLGFLVMVSICNVLKWSALGAKGTKSKILSPKEVVALQALV